MLSVYSRLYLKYRRLRAVRTLAVALRCSVV